MGQYDSLLRVFRTEISDQTRDQIKTVPSSSNITVQTNPKQITDPLWLGMKVGADGDERPNGGRGIHKSTQTANR